MNSFLLYLCQLLLSLKTLLLIMGLIFVISTHIFHIFFFVDELAKEKCPQTILILNKTIKDLFKYFLIAYTTLILSIILPSETTLFSIARLILS